MTTTDTTRTAVGRRFLEALGRRDYIALEACLRPNATLRAIVPSGVREDDGAPAVVARYRRWTEALDDYQVVDGAADELADMIRIRYVVRGIDPEIGEATLFEQTAYAEVEDGAISAVRVACSGDRPAA